MFKKCLFSATVVLLLSSASFATIGQTHGYTIVASNNALIIGHCQRVYSPYYCGAVGLQHIRFYSFHCRPMCRSQRRSPHIVEGGDASANVSAVSYGGDADAAALAVGGDAISGVALRPSFSQPCIVKGGNASANASAVSYGGDADAAAIAVGGDAISRGGLRIPFTQPCVVKGGDASATAIAVSHDGSACATAHAVGGDAI